MLNEFNKPEITLNLKRRHDRGSASITASISGNSLVDMNCFVLMPNHFHLIVKQIEDKGITGLMQRLGTGYTLYFNKKYKRTGALFEGHYKAVFIDSDEYIVHLSRYIHLNPVKIMQPDWKEEGIKDREKTKEFLRNYRWSSYPDYAGINNFNTGVKKDFITGYFDGKPKKYEEFMIEAEPLSARKGKENNEKVIEAEPLSKVR